MRKIVAFFILLLLCNIKVCYADQVQTNLESGTYQIEAKTATITLNISENQTVTVFKDTLLFEENFNKFLREGCIISGTIIGGENVLTLLPNSMTQMPGCKARSIKLSADSACNLQNANSKFRTSKISIPDNSKLSFHVKNGNSKSQLTVIDTIFHLKKNADSIKHVYLSSCTFVEFGKIEGEGNTLLIDDIKITTPREIIPYSLNGNMLSLQGLMPETKYYIEILNQDLSVANTYYFTTPKQISNFSAEVVNFDSVLLSWENNETVSNLLLSVDSIANMADDLLISKVATTSGVNVVEIYNPTERDICLKDYEFLAYHSSFTISSAPLRYVFYEKDSIKSDKSIIIALNSKVSPNDTNLVVYPIITNTSFQGGNDSYLIVKRLDENLYDTIDLFGRVKITSTDEEIVSYANSILVRKPYIKQGVRQNPLVVDSIYAEWDIQEFNANILSQILGNHTIIPAIEIHNLYDTTLSFGQNTLNLINVSFNGGYRCEIKANNEILSTTTFRMGKEINAIANGYWNDANIWENGLIPSKLDKVILPYGVKINIPQNVVAECANLVIHSDYSTCDTVNKAEIVNNGTLYIGKTIVKPYFSISILGDKACNLFALPINIFNKTREEIVNNFSLSNEDELYSLKENVSQSESAWIPYNENVNDSNFFKQNLGYLLSYSQSKELLWQGDLFLEDELELLNNASYTPQLGNGYHLSANPYSHSVNYNNFSMNNISGMWLLKPKTGQYIPYNPNESSEFIIPPFGGFITKVESSENFLKIHNQEIYNQESNNSFIEKLHLTFKYEGGEDEVKVYFHENATESIDAYDVYKLFSFGSAPDLCCNVAQNNLSIVSLPLWEDSVVLSLSYIAKNQSNYELKLNSMPANVLRAELYDSNNELLVDFVEDSTCYIQTQSENEEKTLTLKLYSFDLGFSNLNNNPNFKVIQNGNLVKIELFDKIDNILLYDNKGVKVNESSTYEIVIPKQGCYVMIVRIKGQNHTFKLIYF